MLAGMLQKLCWSPYRYGRTSLALVLTPCTRIYYVEMGGKPGNAYTLPGHHRPIDTGQNANMYY